MTKINNVQVCTLWPGGSTTPLPVVSRFFPGFRSFLAVWVRDGVFGLFTSHSQLPSPYNGRIICLSIFPPLVPFLLQGVVPDPLLASMGPNGVTSIPSRVRTILALGHWRNFRYVRRRTPKVAYSMPCATYERNICNAMCHAKHYCYGIYDEYIRHKGIQLPASAWRDNSSVQLISY